MFLTWLIFFPWNSNGRVIWLEEQVTVGGEMFWLEIKNQKNQALPGHPSAIFFRNSNQHRNIGHHPIYYKSHSWPQASSQYVLGTSRTELIRRLFMWR